MRKYGKILQEACGPEHYNSFQSYTDKRRGDFREEGKAASLRLSATEAEEKM
jgi:hypothetical protein